MAQPAKVRAGLRELRSLIRKAAPGAEEVISYNMPGFKLHGMLAWYAAASSHFGLYPKANVIRVFTEKLKGYETSAGTIRFPFGKPLPKKLITEIIRFRVEENLAARQKKKAVNRVAKPAQKKSKAVKKS